MDLYLGCLDVSETIGDQTQIESMLYCLSTRFHGFLFQQEKEAEPILVID